MAGLADGASLNWRVGVLRTIFAVALFFGTVPAVLAAFAAHEPNWLRLAALSLPTFLAFSWWHLRRSTRHVQLLAMAFVLLVTTLIGLGIVDGGVGSITALTLSVVAIFASVFFKPRLTAVVVVLQSAFLFGAGWLVSRGMVGFEDLSSISTWAKASLVYCGSMSMIGASVSALIARLERGIAERDQALLTSEQHSAARIAESERRLAAEAALARSQQLELVGRVAAGVAHDLNNALMVILAWTDDLRDPTLDPAKREEVVEAVIAASQGAARITRQLTAQARREVSAPVPTALGPVVEQTVRTCERVFPADIRVRAELSDVPAAHVDSAQIEQALLNLALNARDAMPSGGELVIALKLGTRSGFIDLEVRDNGVGMSPETQARIFEPFFTTKHEGRGAGLGLASSRYVIEQNGGTLSVRSEPNRGSTFTISVPVAANQPSVASDGQVRIPAGTTVLLLEDEPEIREVLAHGLTAAGCVVLPVENVARALEVLRRHRQTIDLLCTDGVVTDDSVQRVIDEARALHPAVKVLVFSGHVFDETIRQRISGGDYAFLAKPFTTATLLTKLSALLAARQA